MKLAKTKRKLSVFVHKLTLNFHAKKWHENVLEFWLRHSWLKYMSLVQCAHLVKNPHYIYYEIAVRVVLTFDKLRHDVWYVLSL